MGFDMAAQLLPGVQVTFPSTNIRLPVVGYRICFWCLRCDAYWFQILLSILRPRQDDVAARYS